MLTSSRNSRRQSDLQLRWQLRANTTFPYGYDRIAQLSQTTRGPPIPTLIAPYLLLPIASVGFRPLPALGATGMSVPEATMHEYCYLGMLKDEVWFSRQAIDVARIMIASNIEHTTQCFLRQCKRAAHGLHYATTFPSRKHIHGGKVSRIWWTSSLCVRSPYVEHFLVSNENNNVNGISTEPNGDMLDFSGREKATQLDPRPPHVVNEHCAGRHAEAIAHLAKGLAETPPVNS
jgi:hypothetical protein